MYTTIVKTHCNLGYTKITNSDSFGDFKNVYCSLFPIPGSTFLYRPDHKVFRTEILQTCDIYHQLHADLFSIFLKLQNMIFNFFQKKKRATCSLSYKMLLTHRFNSVSSKLKSRWDRCALANHGTHILFF
jgi:hypothetical protein